MVARKVHGTAIALAALAVGLGALTAASAAPTVLTPTRISTDTLGGEAPGAHATEVEPSAVAFGRRIVAAFQVGRGFGGGAAAIGYATSADGGDSWHSGLLPKLTRWTPDPGSQQNASDPVVAYDASHARWLVAILSRGLGTAVSSSPDGVTWGAPVPTGASGAILDKEWLTCDNWSSSPSRGRCYLAVSTFNAEITRAAIAVQASSDGGVTWSSQVEIPVAYNVVTDTLSAEPIVRPNGELVIVYFERDAVRAVRSTDGGLTFGAPETISSYSQRPYSFAPERFRGTPVPTVAVDAAGTVWASWYDCRFRAGCSGNDVVVSRSVAPGSWSPPVRVPLGPQDATDYVLPALGIDDRTRGDGTHVAIAYYTLSSHDCAGEGCRVHARLATSTNGGRTWRVENVGEPMQLDWMAPTGIGRMLADYVAAVFVPGRVVGIFALAQPPSGGRYEEAIYAVSAPIAPTLSAVRLAATPRAPVAGRTFRVRVTGVRVAGAGWIAPESTACGATPSTLARTAGPCRWRIANGARGRRLSVTVTARYQGATIRTVRSFRIR